MNKSSPDYKKLFLEESKRRQEAECARQEAQQEAERAQQEAERAQQEAERAQQEAERARQEAERAVRQTTLPEFLDACHTHLQANLTVQRDSTLSTQGDPSNAVNKVRPERIHQWEDFADQQEQVWSTLVNSDFMLERHFTLISTLREIGESIRRQMMSSELDLHHFERLAVGDPVSRIIERLYDNPALRDKFNLKGSVKFENHSNTLSPDRDVAEDMSQIQLSRPSRRRSPRFLERQKSTEIEEQSAGAPPIAAIQNADAKPARPNADQFCVYNISVDTSTAGPRIPVFIIEYKPPHKLTLGHIYGGLDDMCLDDVVSLKDTDGPKERCRRLVAAVITQAFSYMIQAGLQFGCVRSGEASIFLRVPDDPSTVHYFLSVPKGDVGESTGWRSAEDSHNRLHLTAVGQMVAFTLQALQTTPRAHRWRSDALSRLPRWEIVYEDLLRDIPVKEAPSSEYRPPRETSFLRASPIRLRHHAQRPAPTCQTEAASRYDSESDDCDPETPSRRLRPPSSLGRAAVAKSGSSTSRSKAGSATDQRYCSQQCLLGLLNGDTLDRDCPNVREHGRDHHQLDQQSFLLLLQRQLQQTMDENFAPIGSPGSRGVPFMVKLKSHGYTLAAKCTPSYFAKFLRYETTVYSRLRPIQGIHIPVHLGMIELPQPYYYEGIVDLTHAILLSFGGMPIGRQVNAANYQRTVTEVERALDAIHKLHVRHKDVRLPNILRDPVTEKIIIIDFERAEMQPSRPALGVISPNRKRRMDESGFVEAPVDVERTCSSETGIFGAELLYLISRPVLR